MRNIRLTVVEAIIWSLGASLVALPVLLFAYATALHVRYINIGIPWWDELSLMFGLYFKVGVLIALGTIAVVTFATALVPRLLKWPAIVVEVPAVAWVVSWILWLNDIILSEGQGYEVFTIAVLALFVSRIPLRALARLTPGIKRAGAISLH